MGITQRIFITQSSEVLMMPHAYYRNDNLHRHLKISTIEEEIKRLAVEHEEMLNSCVNTKMLQVLDNTALELRRTKPFELVP